MEDSVENRDIADSIRIEASTLSPKEHADATHTMNELSQFIEGEFGAFMSPDAKKRALDARNNMITIDSMTEFLYAFLPEEEEKLDFFVEEGMHGKYHDPQRISFVKDQNRLWDEASQQLKASAIRLMGDEQTAKTRFGRLMTTGILAHELAHSYIDPKLPLPLQELGSYYIQDQASRAFFNGYSIVPVKVAEIYEGFLKKYGNDFSRYLFGEKVGILMHYRLSRDKDIKELKKRDFLRE